MRHSLSFKIAGKTINVINLSACIISLVLKDGKTAEIGGRTGARGKMSKERPGVFYVTLAADLLDKDGRNDTNWFDCFITMFDCKSVKVTLNNAIVYKAERRQ